jgi:hypothetical protein
MLDNKICKQSRCISQLSLTFYIFAISFIVHILPLKLFCSPLLLVFVDCCLTTTAPMSWCQLNSTPLIGAADNGRVAVVKRLLKAGADKEAKDYVSIEVVSSRITPLDRYSPLWSWILHLFDVLLSLLFLYDCNTYPCGTEGSNSTILCIAPKENCVVGAPHSVWRGQGGKEQVRRNGLRARFPERPKWCGCPPPRIIRLGRSLFFFWKKWQICIGESGIASA